MDIGSTSVANEFDLRGVAAVLRRQSRVIAYTFLLLFGLAGIYLISVTPTFTATALVFVDPETKNILDSGAVSSGNSVANNARVDSEVEILRSSAVALAVVEDEQLMNDREFGPRLQVSERFARVVGVAQASALSPELMRSKTLANFKESVSVRRRGLTYLISVAVTSQSPARAAELANSMARIYIDQQVQVKISGSLAARDILQSQIETARQILAGYETEFDHFVERNLGLISSDVGNGDFDELSSNLSAMRTQIETKSQIHGNLSLFLDEQDWAALADLLADQSLLDLENQRQELLNDFSGAALAADETTLEQVLADIEAELDRQSDAELQSLAAEIRTLDRNASDLRRDMRSTMLSGDLSSDLLTEIFGLQQESSIARAQYQVLLSRLRDLETQARIQIADSRIVSPALAPIAPTFPNKNLVLLVALAASVGLGVSLAFLNEYYIGGITSANQLSEILQVPTATTVPLSNESNTGRLSVAEKIIDAPLSTYSESIRKLKATIDQAFRERKMASLPGVLPGGQIILVTSSLADEGKTTTALSLARTYALAGKKTLLIDADLRRPSLHRHLGYEPQVGFLDYLRDPEQAELSNAFYARDPASPLALIMGSGRSEVATDQLLNTATFEGLMEQTREVYDITIIDSPPLLPVVDARYIAHFADAVVMVVKWAATSQNDLRGATLPLRTAMKSGAAFLPVLVQSEARPSASRYDDYYSGYSAAI